MLAVGGGKRGVGTTTVTLGLTDVLARNGAEPVALDADRTMPDLGRRAGIEGGGVAAYAAGAPLAAASRRAPRLSDTARVLAAAPGLDDRDLRRAVRRLAGADRPAVVDVPGGVGRDAATPLRVAEVALLVTAPTEPTLRGTATATAMARTLGATPLGVVVVGCGDPSTGHVLPCPVVGTVPTVDRPLHAPGARRAYGRISSEIEARTLFSVDRSLPRNGRPAADGHRRARPEARGRYSRG